MEILPLHYPLPLTLGVVGNIISFLVYVSTVPIFWHMYKKKTTEGYHSVPYLVSLFSSALWVYYAVLQGGQFLLITINGFGVVIETAYVLIFLAYEPKRSKLLNTKLLLVLSLGASCLVVVFTMLCTKGQKRVNIVGIVCVIYSLAFVVTPLSVMRTVVRTKNVVYMPFGLSLSLMANTLCWFLYGLLLKNIFICIPNAVGVVSGMLQLVVYVRYMDKKGTLEVVEDTKSVYINIDKSGGDAFKLIVNRGEPTLVPPAEGTQNGLYFLNNLDQNDTVIIRTIYSFKSEDIMNDSVGKVLKDALAKVLVHYYPVAGCLTISDEGKLIVNCTGRGILFVEADINCSITEIGEIPELDPDTLGNLVPEPPKARNLGDKLLLLAQVTKFKCGGFMLGLAMNHCLFDGISATEFVKSWSEIARGVPLSVLPFLDRTILKAQTPPKPKFQCHEFVEIIDPLSHSNLIEEELQYKSFCFDPQRLQLLNEKATLDMVVHKCTDFEALCAFVWKARTEALEIKYDLYIELFVAVDGRTRFDPALPKGYFGNGVVLTKSVCRAKDLLFNPLSSAVMHIQKTIEMITDGYLRSAVDELEVNHTQLLDSTLLIINWSGVYFYDVDFGWGEPLFAGPVILPQKQVISFVPNGKEKERKGLSVYLGLPVSSMRIFERLMQI